MTTELPTGWKLSSLGQVCLLNPKEVLEDDLNIGFMPMSGLPTNYFGKCNFELSNWCDVKKGYTQFKDGDVIFAKITPCFENGKSAIISDFPSGWGAGSTEYYVLRRVSDLIDSKYLFAFIKTKKFSIDGIMNMSGSVGHKRVPKTFVSEYILPIPPLAEQKAIAEKLDSLLAQVEATKTRLEGIPDILKQFRQSVLAAAVSGELTEDWRKNKKLTGWKAKKLANIVSKIEAGKNLKCIETPPSENQCGIIKISAVTWGVYDEEQSKTLPSKGLFIESRRIKVGDFLISRANTIELLGSPVIVQRVTKELMLSDKVLRLVMPDRYKKWVSIFLRSNNGRREIESRSTGNQMSMRNIGQKALLDINLPIPPIEEQNEIVQRVEELFTFADNIEAKAKTALASVNHLTQSILAQAFSGELTKDWRQQNPDLISGENSAEALLKRIKAERETLKPAKKKRKSA